MDNRPKDMTDALKRIGELSAALDMAIKADEWVSVADGLPTEDGALETDASGCVLAWDVHNGVRVVGWHRLGKEHYLSHWKYAPLRPADAPRGMDCIEQWISKRFTEVK